MNEGDVQGAVASALFVRGEEIGALLLGAVPLFHRPLNRTLGVTAPSEPVDARCVF